MYQKLKTLYPLIILICLIYNSCITEADRPSAQYIVRQWMEFESAKFNDGEIKIDLLEKLDSFYSSVEAFSNSQMYQIYRFATHSDDRGSTHPREVSVVLETLALTISYREALVNEDVENLAFLSDEINTALFNWLLLDAEMERFSGTGFFRLLWVLVLFIGITAIVIRLLHRSFLTSIEKEKESFLFNRAFLLAQEEERGRISRELHDTIAQDLRYISLGMETIAKTLDQKQREKLCEDASEAQLKIIARIRDICNFLVPPDFLFQGIPNALRRLCQDFKKRTGIDCRIEIMEDLDLKFLNEENQLQVFRIIQESLNNIEKHAKAKEAIVIMRSDPEGKIFIGIQDDGIGFKPGDELGSYANMGIRGMEIRAAILGGALEIRSEEGEGTLVCLELPVPKLPVPKLREN